MPLPSFLGTRPGARRRPAAAAGSALALALAASTLVLAPSVQAAPDSDIEVSDAFRTTADLGFHDVTAAGTERPVRNDLAGALQGQVELAQSSTVNPSGNSALELPTLVAQRTALLLFTPLAPVTGLSVEVSVDGTSRGVLDLAPPSAIPAADQTFSDGRETVAYSLRAWSVEIPWEWVAPGMSLELTDATGTRGTLTAIDVAAPNELVINNIRLGMLTSPPVGKGQRFLNDPANGGTDYFQTIPVSKLTIAQYEDVTLDKVIVASGAIYTVDSPSPVNGNVYSGDMRENVGKAQVSTGINLAAFGITSSPMNQKQSGLFNQRIIHHSAGLYANGVQSHGLSGGNGMATLYSSVGNELSHELGHSYGLGHYPGTDTSKTGDAIVINATHHMDSGWGYIAHRGLMRSNLSTAAFNPAVSVNGYPFSQNLAGQYTFNKDAMAGGEDNSPVSDYTHHTGYSAKRIQQSLKTLVPDTSYPSGYRDWDAAAGEYVDAKVKNPSFAQPRPVQVGVPVVTLLGGYNPAKPEQAVLYPAFRSNYGNTFDLPQADTASTSAARACWLQVSYLDGTSRSITLDASDGVKQLNVNVAEASAPTGAEISCRADGQTTRLGDPITIETGRAPMPAAVVVGQEAGFEALRTQELARLTPILEAMAASPTPVLGAADMIVLTGWKNDLSLLSPSARAVATTILEREAAIVRIDTFLNEHAAELAAGDIKLKAQLARHLKALGMVDSAERLLPTGTQVTVDGGKCLGVDSSGAQPIALATKDAAGCAATAQESWFVDARGAIHPIVRPDLCLRGSSPAALVPCDRRSTDQQWVLQSDGHVVRAANTASALDLKRSTSEPGIYGRSGTTNQIWKGLQVSSNPVLVSLSPVNLRALFALDLDALQDVTAPVLSAALTPTAPAESGWFLEPVTLVVTGDDDFGVTPSIEMSTDAGAFTSSAPTMTFDEGARHVALRALDGAGNISPVLDQDIRVDATAAVSTIAMEPTTRTVTLAASDATSGVARIEYRLSESGAWLTYAEPVKVPATRTVVQFRALDNAGNVEQAGVTTASGGALSPVVRIDAPAAPAAAPAAGATDDSRSVGGLAMTGAQVGALVALVGALLAGGVWLVLAARRRGARTAV